MKKKQCGKCKACVRNAIAFKLNNINTSDLYNFDIFKNTDVFIQYSNKIKISSIGKKRKKEYEEIIYLQEMI